MAYNASHDTIILSKNKLVGQYQLILQPCEAAYHQELSAMQQERYAENQLKEEREMRFTITHGPRDHQKQVSQ